MKRFVLLVMLSLAACEKTSDVGAMHDEATGVVNTYKAKFDAAAARMKTLNERGQQVKDARTAPDFPEVSKLFSDTQRKLSEMQNLVRAAPQTLAEKSKKESARPELIAALGDYKTRFEHGHREINRNLDTVESWIAYSEMRPRAQAPQPPQPKTDQPDAPPPPPEPEQAGSGSAGDGSAAPKQ